MDRLQAMEVFIRVVDTNSFTKAAHTLNMPRASVTNIIQNLEAYLKVRLLQRTTRRLNLTADGASYYARCVRVLAEIDEIEGAFSATKIVPRGRLRIETSGPVGKLILVPALDDFHARYPEIELTIGMSDRRVDIIEDGVDCAIRVGSLIDSNMVARRLADFHFVTAATPGYLQRHGQPAGPRRPRRRQIHLGAHVAADGPALRRRQQGCRSQDAQHLHGQRRRGAAGRRPEGTGRVPGRADAGAAAPRFGSAG